MPKQILRLASLLILIPSVAFSQTPPSPEAVASMFDTIVKLGPVFSGISALLAACALAFAVYQLRMVVRWNRLQAAFTYFPNPLTLESLENELEEKIRFWSRPKNIPITVAEAQLLHFQSKTSDTLLPKYISEARATLTILKANPPKDDAEFLREMRQTGRKLKAYLNELERYSIGVNAGVVDERAAYHIYSAKFVGHYARVKALVERTHQEREDKSIYGELGRVAERWERAPDFIKKEYPARW